MGHLGLIAEAQSGKRRERHGNFLFGAFGRDFACADGVRVMVVGLTLKQWRSLCAATDLTAAMQALGTRLGLDLDRDNWAHQDPLDPSHQWTVMGSPGPLTPTKQRGLVGNQHAPLTSSSLRNSVKRLGSDGSAWAVMERLRVENVALKAQVGDMQRELQGCIELIGHMRL